jgi:hypothetical protein
VHRHDLTRRHAARFVAPRPRGAKAPHPERERCEQDGALREAPRRRRPRPSLGRQLGAEVRGLGEDTAIGVDGPPPVQAHGLDRGERQEDGGHEEPPERQMAAELGEGHRQRNHEQRGHGRHEPARRSARGPAVKGGDEPDASPHEQERDRGAPVARPETGQAQRRHQADGSGHEKAVPSAEEGGHRSGEDARGDEVGDAIVEVGSATHVEPVGAQDPAHRELEEEQRAERQRGGEREPDQPTPPRAEAPAEDRETRDHQHHELRVQPGQASRDESRGHDARRSRLPRVVEAGPHQPRQHRDDHRLRVRVVAAEEEWRCRGHGERRHDPGHAGSRDVAGEPRPLREAEAPEERQGDEDERGGEPLRRLVGAERDRGHEQGGQPGALQVVDAAAPAPHPHLLPAPRVALRRALAAEERAQRLAGRFPEPTNVPAQVRRRKSVRAAGADVEVEVAVEAPGESQVLGLVARRRAVPPVIGDEGEEQNEAGGREER